MTVSAPSNASSQPAYRGRFAPSPTGPLHLGSLLAALGSWLRARQHAGVWLVRIENVDRVREVPGIAQQQLRTLQAFGLYCDEPVLWQHQREHAYQQAIHTLRQQHLAFDCHCSRADLAATAGIHRHCVASSQRPTPAIRLRVKSPAPVQFVDGLQGAQQQDVAAEVGDVVLRRADGLWAYQLAVVVDDAAQGITEVVRGADLLDSTARQILLQRALGLPTPAYLHLPLVRDQHGRKLSKSLAALPVDAKDPLPALRQCWQWLGQDAAPLAACGNVDAWLARAQVAFDSDRLQSRLARIVALHNE